MRLGAVTLLCRFATTGSWRRIGGATLGLTLGIAGSLGACSSDSGGTSSGEPLTDAGGGTDSPSGDTGTGDSGSSDTGTDSPATGNVGPGPYTLVYAGTFVGIDGRSVDDGKATFDGMKMTAYAAKGTEADESPKIGTNTASDVAGSSLFAIGRWGGGTTDGKFYEAGTAGKMTFAANGGFHYAIGIPANPLPASGTVTYTVDKKTAATVSDGSSAPGTINGSLAIAYAGTATKVGLSVTIDIPGSGTYTAETTGGIADPSQSEAMVPNLTGPNAPKGIFYFNKNITNAGAACAGSGSCAFGVDGAIYGPSGETVALAVHVYAGAGGSPKSVSGILAFKK